MTKEVQMTFRIEPELRAQFAEAALQEDRPAAQVLREFMRAYVEQARERGSAKDAISPIERRWREDAARFAHASVSLEGFKPSKEVLAQIRRHIDGEIPLAGLVQVKPDAEEAHSR